MFEMFVWLPLKHEDFLRCDVYDSEEAAPSDSSDAVSDISVQQTSDAIDPLPDCSGSTKQGTINDATRWTL